MSGEAGRDASVTDASAPKGPFPIAVAQRCYVDRDPLTPYITGSGESLRVSTIMTQAWYDADGGAFKKDPGRSNHRDVLTLWCLLKTKQCKVYRIGLAALDRGEPLEAYSIGSSDDETLSVRSATRLVIENARDKEGETIEVDTLAGQIKVISRRSLTAGEWRGEGTCENAPPPKL